jgi:MFS family permease
MGRSKWGSISLIALSEILVFGLWFSISAVIPSLKREYGITDLQAALYSTSVAVGFVAGTLASAILGLADRLDPKHFFSASALIAAIANAALLAIDPASPWIAVFRFITGACMAGTYPVGMKMVASWAKADLGLLVGLLIGALTLGSASPHLFNAFGGLDWRFTLLVTSAAAAAAGLLIHFVGLGPRLGRSPPFEPAYVIRVLKNPPLRLANLGYLGHMWELYAMWAWIGVFLDASFALTLAPERAAFLARLAAFATIGAGALGCVVGGIFADRAGRTTLTMLAMGVSGACSLLIGFLFGGDPLLLTLLCLVWGIAVVADSAQFSAAITELVEPSHTGTALTVQVCLGFLLTLATIYLIPPLVAAVGWRYAFAGLSIGPFLGVLAMARLRARPEAVRLAGGRR